MKKNLIYLLLLLNFFAFAIDANPVSLVWQVSREKAWEEDWVLELLQGVDINIVDDGDYKKYID
nr:hypothetical protein [Parachlamydiaceae bacterium]